MTGIAADMAVITAGGIVGKVLRVYPSTSLVLMINDQSSGVGALLEKSRLQGVLRGTPNGELILERVMSDEQVVPGDTVLSSGGDQIFPKGLPVGTVSAVSPGREMFLNIRVKPAADLSRLEEVLVVTEKQEREPVADNGVRVSAAEVLAQRLPSVPDKPPVAAPTPGTTATAPGTAAPATAGAAGANGSAAHAPASTAAHAPVGNGQATTAETPKKEVLKPVVQKTASGDTPKVTPKSTAVSAKPATTAPPKPAGTPPNPQPAASTDDPH